MPVNSYTNSQTTKIATTAFVDKLVGVGYKKVKECVWVGSEVYIPHNAFQLIEVQRLMEKYPDAHVTIEQYTEDTKDHRIVIRFQNNSDEALFILKENK